MSLSSRIVSASIVSIALLFCSIIFTSTWKSINRSQQTITVVGSAKTSIVSDIGVLRGAISFTVDNPKEGFVKIPFQMESVKQFLAQKGILMQSFEVQPITQFANYEFNNQGYQTGAIANYTVTQRFQCSSNNVSLVKNISLKITDLVQEGISLQMDMPEYYYSKLSDIKINIQTLATKDAQQRAQAMTEATGQTLGAMRSAKMGVLQITPKNSNVISDYGMNDASSIEKDVTAVVHTSFEID